MHSTMKSTLIFTVFNLLFASFALASSALNLSVGEERPIELGSIAKSVDISNTQVIAIKKGATKAVLLVQAKRLGQATLTVQLTSGQTEVYQVEVTAKSSSALGRLRSIPGLTITENNGKLMVQGTIRNRKDLVALQRIKSESPGSIIDATDTQLASSNTIVTTINDILKENDIANIQASAYGRIIVLEGSPKDEGQAEIAFRIAAMIHPQIENKLSKISKGGPSIGIEVLFVEVSRENKISAGFNPIFGKQDAVLATDGAVAQASISGKRGVSKAGDMTLGWQVGGIATFLRMIQDRSFTRVLSNPKLVARSGEQAKFHAGQTVYVRDTKVIPEASEGSEDKGANSLKFVETLTPIETGILLNIDTKLDALGQIDAKINTSVSELGSTDKGGAISVSKSAVDTAVTIKEGQTIMLSGLIRKQNNKTVHRVPVLADIPLLGELFKSRESNDKESEMLILVTMSRAHASDESLRGKATAIWDSAAQDVEFKLRD